MDQAAPKANRPGDPGAAWMAVRLARPSAGLTQPTGGTTRASLPGARGGVPPAWPQGPMRRRRTERTAHVIHSAEAMPTHQRKTVGETSQLVSEMTRANAWALA